MSRRVRIGLAFVVAVAAGTGAAAPDPPETTASVESPPGPVESARPAPGVRLDRIAGGSRHTIVPPGPLLDIALARRGDGTRQILALVAPAPPDPTEAPACDRGDPRADRALQLIRVDLAGALLETVRDDLPGRATGLHALDLDGDGEDEIVLALPDRLIRVDPTRPADGAAAPVPLFELSGLGAIVTDRSAGAAAAPAAPALTRPGELLVLEPVGLDRLVVRSRVALPLNVARRSHGLHLSSPAVRALSRSGSRAALYAAGPETLGPQRLRTLLFDPEREDGEPQESWSRFPDAEEVLDHAYLMLDGQPVLAVATRRADKLGFFAEKRLRLFALGVRDRSRSGIPPLFAAQTRANLWQAIHFFARDVNDDGREDLILGYWKGLKKDRVVVDAYLRREDGSFPPGPQTTSFDVADGDRSYLQFGHDLDGDGTHDLLVGSGQRILMFAGRASSNGRKLVEPEPRRSWGLDHETERGEEGVAVGPGGAVPWRSGGRLEGPWPTDLDGDGSPEILFVQRGDKDGVVLVLGGGAPDAQR